MSTRIRTAVLLYGAETQTLKKADTRALDSTSIQECYEGSLASRGNHTHLSLFFTEIFQWHDERYHKDTKIPQRYHKDTKTSFLGHIYLSGNHDIANGIEDDLRKPFQTV